MPRVEVVSFSEEYAKRFDAPVPAEKVLPEWFKSQNVYTTGSKVFANTGRVNKTTKGCPSVVDAILAGYIFVTPCDFLFSRVGDGYDVSWPNDYSKHINAFPKEQTNNSGIDTTIFDSTVFKLNTEWVFKTPNNYSSLIISPMWRDCSDIMVLPGIIDTDTYESEMNFPFIIRKGFEGIIPQGTPLAQVIPFKRDAWVHSLSVDYDNKYYSKSMRRANFYEGWYNRFVRAKKSWK